MDALMTLLGVFGSCGGTLMYFLYERNFISSSDPKFYIVNGVAAFFVLVACAYKFDGGDIGAIAQEACWMIISGSGVVRLLQKNSKKKNSNA